MVHPVNNGPRGGPMAAEHERIFQQHLRQAGLVAALAISFSAVSSSQSFAFSAEAQQMCTGDAFRLCSSEISNVPKITACMFKHKAELSTGCRTVMERDLAPSSPRSPPSNTEVFHGLVKRLSIATTDLSANPHVDLHRKLVANKDICNLWGR